MSDDPIENTRASIAYTRSRYGISNEALEYRRRRGPDKIIEPTEADWAQYRGALAAAETLDRIGQNPQIYIGPIEIEEPRSRREPGEYAETEDDWIRRVAKLIADSGGELPEDLDRAFTVREFKTVIAGLTRYKWGQRR